MSSQTHSNEATDVENRQPSRVGLTDLLGGVYSIGIAWNENLEAIGDPLLHGPFSTSCPDRYTPSPDEILRFQLRLLADRCDALLRRSDEQGRLIVSLMRK